MGARTLEVEGEEVAREAHLAGDVGVEEEALGHADVVVANGLVHWA